MTYWSVFDAVTGERSGRGRTSSRAARASFKSASKESGHRRSWRNKCQYRQRSCERCENRQGWRGGGRCQKCSEMHNELTRNLREKAEDKQEILRLEKKVQEVQAQLVKTEANAHQAHQAASDKDQQIKEKTLKIAALDANLQVLMQECASRTIEIDQLRPKLRDLHAENQQLISQLLAFKESMADRYNEINAMQEEAVRIKRSAELMAAASSVPTASPHTPCDAGGENALVSTRMSSSGLTFGCKLPEAPRQTLVAHERSEIHALAHNCSGAMVLTGSDDRTIKLWDSRNGTRLAALEGAVKGVMCVAFSNDGKLVLGASNDFAVRIWSLTTSRVLHALTGHQSKIYCAGFSADSRSVFSGGYDRLLKLWDVQRGLVTHSINCTSSCNDAAMSPQGTEVISVHLDASVRLWDVRSAQLAHEITRVHTQPITSVCLVPDNPNEIVTNSRDDSLQLLDIRTYTSIRGFQHQSYKNGVNWNRATVSPDAQYVVAGGHDGSVVLWRKSTGEHLSTLRNGHKSAVVACSWGNNDQLVSVEREHSMIFWE